MDGHLIFQFNTGSIKLLRQHFGFIILAGFAGHSFAVAPVPFDGWTESNGTVSVTCPSGYRCEQNVSDQGISVMTLVDSEGNRFFHQVISETGVDGTRTSSESFVGKSLETDINANSNGIALKQVVSTTTDESLTSSVLLNTGWSNDGVSPSVAIDQSLKQIDATTEFDESFSFQSDRNDAGVVQGHELDIWQRLRFMPVAGSGQTAVDSAEFIHKQASGTRTPAAGSVSLPDGSTMVWQAGDSLRTTWLGQDCNGCSGASSPSQSAMFSLQTFDNESDGELEIYTRNIFELQQPVWGSAPMDDPLLPR